MQGNANMLEGELDRDEMTLKVAEEFHKLADNTKGWNHYARLESLARRLIVEFVSDQWARDQILMALKGLSYAYGKEVVLSQEVTSGPSSR